MGIFSILIKDSYLQSMYVILKIAMNWTQDSNLPECFAKWKTGVEDEILLFEGEEKPVKYVCNCMWRYAVEEEVKQL